MKTIEITLSAREAAQQLAGKGANEEQVRWLTRELRKAATAYRHQKPGYEVQGCKTETLEGNHRFAFVNVQKWALRNGRAVARA